MVAELEARGLTCWVAPRDIPHGHDYSEAILAGIDGAKALIVLVSKASLASTHVRSEVARATSDGVMIYPVRLVDIEIAGGLEFFLELSQWVDFFPSPTAESYDRLAEAIRTGRRVDGSRARRRYDPRRWALTTIGGVAAVIALTIAGIWGYSTWQNARMAAAFEEQQRQAQIELAEQQAAREAERAAADLARLDVSPGFSEEGDGIYLTRLYVTGYRGRESDLRVDYRVTGGDGSGGWTGFDNTQPNARARLDLEGFEAITFRIVERATGAVLKEIDKTDALRQVLLGTGRRVLNDIERFARDTNSTCSMSGCWMRYHSVPLCSPAVTAVTLSKDGEAIEIAEDFCARADRTADFCMPPQDLPFDLRPGERFEMTFDLRGGGSETITKEIADRVMGALKPAYAEVPAAAGSPDAPVLVANYTPPDVVGGSFTFLLGWGACDARGQQARAAPPGGLKMLVDTDGGGFVEVDQVNFFSVAYTPGRGTVLTSSSPPIRIRPEPATLRLAYGDATGIKAGPWSYDFDPGAVVAGMAPEAAPRVACSGDRDVPRAASYAVRAGRICMPADRTAFFGVDRVEFGPEPGAFPITVPVAFTPDAYLGDPCDYNRGACSPFVFTVPPSWPGVYSRVVLSDGTTLQPRRHATTQ